MKNLILLLISLSLYTTSQAVTIDIQAAGALRNSVYDYSITDLKITGVIDATDIRFLRDNLNNLTNLDLSQVSILEYIGNDGTDLNTTTYNADRIPPYAFDGKKSLKTIILPSNLTTISSYAFRSCGLISITFPNTVSNLEYYAFQSCTSLTSVTFGDYILYYGEEVFMNCDNLIQLNVQSGNANYSVLDGVIFNKDKTNLVRFPVSKAGNYIIPSTVTSISSSAFAGCRKITGVTIPNTINIIDANVFMQCSSLESIIIPNSVKEISSNAFAFCSNLNNLTIGNSVTKIGIGAFRCCTKLTSVQIPSSVTTIERLAFSECSISDFTVQTDNQYFSTIDGVLYDKNKTILVQYPTGKQGEYIMPNSIISIPNNAFTGCSGLTNITIGNSVRSIGEVAFDGCKGLTNIIIPNSIESIGRFAFQGCINIKSVSIGNSVNSIGEYAFSSLSSLSNINVSSENANFCSIDNVLYDKNQSTIICFPQAKQGKYIIPNTVTSIPDMAFSLCKGLTSIIIGSSVTSIGGYAFQQCTNLQVIDCLSQIPPTVSTSSFYGANPYAIYVPITSVSAYKSAIGWSAFNIIGEKRVTINNPNAGSLAGNLISSGYGPISSITHLTVTGNLNSIDISQMKTNMSALTEIDISDALLSNNELPASAFKDKYILTSISLPSSLISIGDYAFSGCSRLLGNLPISASITSIGNYAFSGCSSITGNLIIPSSLTSINSYSFSGCRSLSGTLTIPNSVSSIGTFAFQGCTNLTGNLIIPNSVNSIGASSFLNCSGFTGLLTLPNSITTIPASTFSNCSGLSGSITIPLSVKNIGTSAFSNCSKLMELFINKNTTIIGDYAYSGCTSLRKISVARTIPPTIYSNSFGGVNKETCSLYVPIGSTSSYQTANYWSLFIFFNEMNFDLTSNTRLTNTSNINIYSNYSEIVIDGTSKGEIVTIYSMDGKHIQTIISKGERINLQVAKATVYLVKSGEKTYKVIL